MWEQLAPASVYVSRVTIVSPLCVLQTKSEAADELEKFRKASVEESSAGPPPSPSSPSPHVFIPPPPLPPTNAPPPPPPVLPQAKPSTLAHPSANAPVNPALAREAMLEAIRSGSAAEKLKKVRTRKKKNGYRSHHRVKVNSAAASRKHNNEGGVQLFITHVA